MSHDEEPICFAISPAMAKLFEAEIAELPKSVRVVVIGKLPKIRNFTIESVTFRNDVILNGDFIPGGTVHKFPKRQVGRTRIDLSHLSILSQ
jgi:hypothetical protein